VKGANPSGDSVLKPSGLVLIFVASDVSALRFHCDTRSQIRELLNAGEFELAVPRPEPEHPPLSYDSS
jgi:hypothetical protein